MINVRGQGLRGGETLVLGAAVGFSEAQIAPFLTSLRQSGYEGDVVLLVEARVAAKFAGRKLFERVGFIDTRCWLPQRRRLWAQPRAIRVLFWYPVQTVLWVLLRGVRWLPIPKLLRRRLQNALAAVLHAPHDSRYLTYDMFLRGTRYSRVLLTDVRDVLFQEDPFRTLPLAGLAVSLETRRNTIISEPLNAHWVRLVYGKEVLEAIGQRPIACSGVTYGDRDSILRYVELMAAGVLDLSLRATWLSIVDQGLHNGIVWMQLGGQVHCLETLASPVATLHGLEEEQLQLSRDGKLLNSDGGVVSVVHQYDRQPSISAVLLGRLQLACEAEG